MNKGTKLWREPNGNWTIGFYRTKDCIPDDYLPFSGNQLERIDDWFSKNNRNGCRLFAEQAMIQWNKDGGDDAIQFLMTFG